MWQNSSKFHFYIELHVGITPLNTFSRFRCDQTVSMSPFIHQKVQSNAFSQTYMKLGNPASSFVHIAVLWQKFSNSHIIFYKKFAWNWLGAHACAQKQRDTIFREFLLCIFLLCGFALAVISRGNREWSQNVRDFTSRHACLEVKSRKFWLHEKQRR